MTTSAKYACAAALLAGLTALPAVAAEPSLLERCWPASALAAREGKSVQSIDIPALQEKLRAQKQVIDFLPGVPEKFPDPKVVEF